MSRTNEPKTCQHGADGRKEHELHTGFSDNLIPLRSLDLSKVHNFSEMAEAMKFTAFGGRTLGEAVDVAYKMFTDPDCFVVLTLSGAMTIAKMGLVICDMIDKGMVDAIVSTGALMAHGFIEAAGMSHFKYDTSMDDKELYDKGYDRVYDTLELEKNLDDSEEIIKKILIDYDAEFRGDEKDVVEICSWKLNQKLGEHLHKNMKGRGVLKSAFEKNIPVYIPAFTDSEFGLDFGCYRRRCKVDGKRPLKFNPFHDLEDYTDKIKEAKKVGIFTIGGGVPRNWAQQVGPYLDILGKRVGPEHGTFKRFDYAVRICPEPVHWGGLSGCTYSEGVSWGKFTPKEEGGMFAEVLCDATIAWPIIIKAVMERMEKSKR